MGLFDAFRRSEKSVPQPRSIEVKGALGSSDSLGKFLMFGTETASTATSALSLYEQSSAVAVPVNMIADHFQQFEPVLLEVGTKDIVSQHPLLDLIRRPSPAFTMELFFQKIAIDYLVTGEAPVIAIGNTNSAPFEIQPLSPSNLSDSEGDNGFADRYIVSGNSLSGDYVGQNEKGVRRYFRDPITELRLIRRFNTKNNSLLRGQSPLVSSSKEARQNIAGGNYNLSLLQNGGRVSLVFHFEEDMSPETFEEVKNSIRESYGGANKAGQIGVTSGGKMSIEQMGANNRDMDFEKLQMMTKLVVAQNYHVPLPLMTTEAMTMNNYGEAKLALFDDAVVPLGKKLLGDLGQWLMPRFDLDPKAFRLTFDPEQVEPLVDRRNARLKMRADMNLETKNELRRELPNRPDVEGGNQLLVPGTLQPIDALGLEVEPFDEDVDLEDDQE